MEHRNSRKIVNYLTVGYCIYALIYIWKTSFVIDGERFFVLLDDAMISMRYAKNFALGHGLVWNPGETPIEGYTNPLWTILMSFFHLFGLPLSKNSLVIQLLCIVFGVFTLRLTWLIVKEIEVKKTESEESSHLILLAQICATFLTAFYLPLITFSLQGMEVAILTPIICYSALLGIRYLRNPASPLSSPIVWVFLLLTISVFIRMDMVVPLIAFGAFLAIAVFTSNTDGTSWSKRKIVWQIILFTSLLAISSVGIQTAFRYWYYGDPLPNTYYLKMAAIPLITRLSKGIFVAANFFVKTGIIIILAPIVYIFLKPRKEYFFLFALITAQVAYSIYVGGDAWEWWGGSNRYISIAMPLFFVLLGVATARIFIALQKHIPSGKLRIFHYQVSQKLFYKLSYVAVVLCLFFSINMIYGVKTIGEFLLLAPTISTPTNEDNVKFAHLMAAITKPKASVAVVLAGVMPYFLERPYIDVLGKNDSYIAHLPIRVLHGANQYTDYHPGHRKWDYSYTIGKLKPDVLAQLWLNTEEAEPYLKEYTKVTIQEREMYLRTDSKEIKWDVVDSLVR